MQHLLQSFACVMPVPGTSLSDSSHIPFPIYTFAWACAERQCSLETAPFQHRCPQGSAHFHSHPQHPLTNNTPSYHTSNFSIPQTETLFSYQVLRQSPNSSQNLISFMPFFPFSITGAYAHSHWLLILSTLYSNLKSPLLAKLLLTSLVPKTLQV